jgi:HEPN domain-containing protein
MPARQLPDDPQEWLNRARSNLALARTQGQDIYLEDLCFNLQQAAEKALKALLIQMGVEFPYVHDIGQLLTRLEASGCAIPEALLQGARLTRFAVFTRYPGIAPSIGRAEYRDALALADAIVKWVEEQL